MCLWKFGHWRLNRIILTRILRTMIPFVLIGRIFWIFWSWIPATPNVHILSTNHSIDPSKIWGYWNVKSRNISTFWIFLHIKNWNTEFSRRYFLSVSNQVLPGESERSFWSSKITDSSSITTFLNLRSVLFPGQVFYVKWGSWTVCESGWSRNPNVHGPKGGNWTVYLR